MVRTIEDISSSIPSAPGDLGDVAEPQRCNSRLQVQRLCSTARWISPHPSPRCHIQMTRAAPASAVAVSARENRAEGRQTVRATKGAGQQHRTGPGELAASPPG